MEKLKYSDLYKQSSGKQLTAQHPDSPVYLNHTLKKMPSSSVVFSNNGENNALITSPLKCVFFFFMGSLNWIHPLTESDIITMVTSLSLTRCLHQYNTNVSHILTHCTVQTYDLFSVFAGKRQCREKVVSGTVPICNTCLHHPEPDRVTSELTF